MRTILLLDVALSLVSLAVYAWDKFAAVRKGRRIPERALHLLSVLGGWPGAALGQAALRHKTQKRAFRRVFWLTVAVNVGLTAAFFAWIAKENG